jgi:hypothetical protein
MSEYSTDPSLQDVPLNPSEIDSYAADPSMFSRDPRKVSHLLRRVAATVSMYKSQIQSLNRDVQDIQMSRSRSGAATTMSPRDAVRFLSPQELAGVVEGTHKALLDHVLSLQTDAKQARRDALSEQNKARFALLSVLEDAAVPSEVRERLQKTLASLPTDHFSPVEAAEPDSSGTAGDGGTPTGPETGPVSLPDPSVSGAATLEDGAENNKLPGGGLEDLFSDSDDLSADSGDLSADSGDLSAGSEGQTSSSQGPAANDAGAAWPGSAGGEASGGRTPGGWM